MQNKWKKKSEFSSLNEFCTVLFSSFFLRHVYIYIYLICDRVYLLRYCLQAVLDEWASSLFRVTFLCMLIQYLLVNFMYVLTVVLVD